MSIINKMLNDLEKRDAFLNESPDKVLDGLYSAYDIELKNKKESNNVFLLSLFFIFLLVAAIYIYLNINNFKSLFLVENQVDYKNEVVVDNDVVDVSLAKEITVTNTKEENELSSSASIKFQTLKLDEKLVVAETLSTIVQHDINRIESIQFEVDNKGLNLVINMPNEIDYLVYGLSNPDRTVIEVKNVELGFRLEELEPVEPIVAIRYSINDDKNFKLVLESQVPLTIKKSITSQSGNHHNLVVMMEHAWEKNNKLTTEDVDIVSIVEKQIEQEKESVFKGDIIKTPVNRSADAYAEKLFQQAYIEYKKGNISESLKKLNKSLNQDASHVKARSTLALILSEKKHYELAYSVLNEGLIQYPENVEWTKMYARLLLNEGKLVEARTMLDKKQPALALNTEYYALQAAVLQKLAEYEEAAKIYRNLLHINPYKGIWWMGLGISLESLKRYDDALYAYQKASGNGSVAQESRQFLMQRINRLNTILEDESS